MRAQGDGARLAGSFCQAFCEIVPHFSRLVIVSHHKVKTGMGPTDKDSDEPAMGRSHHTWPSSHSHAAAQDLDSDSAVRAALGSCQVALLTERPLRLWQRMARLLGFERVRRGEGACMCMEQGTGMWQNNLVGSRGWGCQHGSMQA